MTVDEFISLHGKDGCKPWVSYCECVIKSNGSIYEAVPSHTEFAVKYVTDLEGITRNKLLELMPIYASPIHFLSEKYKLTFVWYDHILMPINGTKNLNVRRVLNRLASSNLISKSCISNIELSREYSICKSRGDVI